MRVVDSVNDPVGARDAAVASLAVGEVVVLPTDTVYGLAATAGDAAATAALFDIKQRPVDRQVAVLVSGTSQLRGLTSEPAAPLARLISGVWPGAVTVVLDSPDGTLGVRCPDHSWLLELLEVTGPLATTSANLHGEPPLHSVADIATTLGTWSGLVVDGGDCEGDVSTVVALRDGKLEILRQGAVEAEAIFIAAGVGGSTS